MVKLVVTQISGASGRNSVGVQVCLDNIQLFSQLLFRRAKGDCAAVHSATAKRALLACLLARLDSALGSMRIHDPSQLRCCTDLVVQIDDQAIQAFSALSSENSWPTFG